MSIFLIILKIFLPLCLSLLLYGLNIRNHWKRSSSILLIWLLSYSWIRDFTPLLPVEALDWVWVFSIAILLSSTIKSLLLRKIVYTVIFAISMVVYAWPVLQSQFSVNLTLELLSFSIIASVFFLRAGLKPLHNPALIICSSATGLAVVATLSGSILIGQLALALAATIGGFAIFEFHQHKGKNYLSPSQLTLLLNIYLALLIIGRIYADLPLLAVVLLALSPLSIVFISRRFNFLISFSLTSIALVQVFLH